MKKDPDKKLAPIKTESHWQCFIYDIKVLYSYKKNPNIWVV